MMCDIPIVPTSSCDEVGIRYEILPHQKHHYSTGSDVSVAWIGYLVSRAKFDGRNRGLISVLHSSTVRTADPDAGPTKPRSRSNDHCVSSECRSHDPGPAAVRPRAGARRRH